MSAQPAPFASPEVSSQWAKGLLIVALGLCVVGVVSGLFQFALIHQALSRGISDAEVAANDSREYIIGILQAVVFFGTAIAFVTWFYRAYKNLPSLGNRDLRYTPVLAVSSFFVPFVNLVRPFQLMRETWHGSDPAGLERDLSSGRPPVRNQLAAPPLLVAWWTLFLLSEFFGQAAAHFPFGSDTTVAQLKLLTGLQILSDALEAPAALLAITLVGRITRWQGERAELIRQRGGSLPTDAAIEPAPAIG
jgi:hypothetical protein